MSHARDFNAFLESLKEKNSVYKEFWEIVVQDDISLITCKESADSSVTPDQAKQFLAPNEETKEDTSLAEEGEDVDDLLDMI